MDQRGREGKLPALLSYALVVHVCQSNGDIFFARRTLGSGDTVTRRCEYPNNDRDDSQNGLRVEEPVERMPHHDTAHHEEAKRIEEVRRAKEVAAQPRPKGVGQEQKGQTGFIRQLMNGIGGETETVGFERPPVLEEPLRAEEERTGHPRMGHPEPDTASARIVEVLLIEQVDDIESHQQLLLIPRQREDVGH